MHVKPPYQGDKPMKRDVLLAQRQEKDEFFKASAWSPLTPEWLARRWNSKYTRVLQVFHLVSVRPALDGVCPNER